MFLTGTVLLIVTSIAFTGGLNLLKPAKPFERFTQLQALLIVAGFATVAVWQLYVNQAFVLQVLGSTPVDQLSLTFAADNAIAEEALLGAFTIFIYLSLRYFKLDWFAAGSVALVTSAAFFTWLHTYVYNSVPQALVFVFGSRIVLSGVLLGTMAFSRIRAHPSASLAAPVLIHVSWNLATVIA